MSEMVWIDGRVHAREEAKISAFDHGFLYGDSIYETIRTARGRPFLLDRHLSRLRQSAAIVEMVLSRGDRFFADAITNTLAAVDHPESAIRIVVTRGVGDLGYERHLCGALTTLIYVRPMPSIREPGPRRGVRIAVVDIRRNDRSAVSPAAKTSNLLNNILGSYQAQKQGAEEGIMLNRDGYVAEGTMSNLFIVRRERVQTPPLDVGILPGITRGFVLDLARSAGLDVVERRFRPDQLTAADEVFLTGTTKGILPVTRVDRHAIGDGSPGPITRRLIHLFDAAEDEIVAGGDAASPADAETKRPAPSGVKRR
ncbi:MAG: aminotransferase class IV [Acidobacteriota bacterium]